ncbi:hypothetical protein [Duganella guangzhouensis]|uniref:hypothetical protein n=1 Tax=Duganella guangzhouensis TaxID=2666084 RepID=UPI0035315B0F
MTVAYEDDVAAWALEQVALLRSGRWALPSLRGVLNDLELDEEIWADAVDIAGREAGLTDLPKTRLWSFEQVLADDYLPS